jgi:hypothetical protein
MAFATVPLPPGNDFVRRLCAEFDCETFTIQAQKNDGTRRCLTVVARNFHALQRRAVFEDKGGPLPIEVVESVLNRLGIPMKAFGLQSSPPPPPSGIVH